jgi:hypothetical protein
VVGAVVREASKLADASSVVTSIHLRGCWFGCFFAGRIARELTSPVYHNTI